jgi:hypothetical protein
MKARIDRIVKCIYLHLRINEYSNSSISFNIHYYKCTIFDFRYKIAAKQILFQ